MILEEYLYKIATGLEIISMPEKTFDTEINDQLDIPSYKDIKGEHNYKTYVIKVHYCQKLESMICEL